MPRSSVPAAWAERAKEMLLVPLKVTEAAGLLDVAAGAPDISLVEAPHAGVSERRRVRRETKGWEALTKSERTVVLLAAEGLTNPEIGKELFISPRTVSTHLERAFAKLGVSSRVELARLVIHRGAQ